MRTIAAVASLLVLLLKAPIPPVCPGVPPCAGILVCNPDNPCDCICFPDGQEPSP